MALSSLARRTLRQALGNDSIGQEIADRLDEPGVSARTMIDALDEAASAESLSIRQSLGLNGYISVKDYGAVGDGRKIQATSVTNSVYTAPSGSFSQDDVGKVAWAVLATGTVIQQLGVVSSVTGSTQATLSGTYNGPGTWLNPIVYIGTNDTTAIQNAWTASKAAGVPMHVPLGMYFINRQVAGAYNENSGDWGVIGDGSQVSRFVVMPDFSFSGATGTAIFYLVNAGRVRVVGIGVDGGYQSLSFAGYYAFNLNSVDPTGRQRNWAYFHDLAVENLTGFTGGFQIGSIDYANVSDIVAYDCAYQGIQFNASIGTVRNIFSSNGGFGPVFSNGADITMIGGLIDEHDQPTVNIEGARVTLKDFIVYGGSTATCISLTGTSTLTLDNCWVTPYNNHNNSSGISIGSGCETRTKNSRIVGTGTGKCVTGAGTLIDEGGNTFTGTVDVTTRKGTTHTSPQLMPTYTVSTLPSASANANGIIMVSNETGGAVLAFSDGTNWRRVTDRAIVS